MTSTARTPQQNGVVERRNHTLVEAARTMLIFSKSLLFLWTQVVATACYTQTCSLIHTRYDKTPYEMLRDRKPELKYLYVFGSLCYPTNDFEDLGKLQPKADIGIFIGYLPSKKAYWIYNKRTKQIMKTMNVKFDELTQMASEQHGSRPNLQGLTSGEISSGLVLNQTAVASNPISAATLPPPDTVRTSSSSTFIDKDAPSLSTSPNIKTTTSSPNSTNVKPNEKVLMFDSDTFSNPFAPPNTSSVESSSRIVDTLNMHTFQQPPIYTKRWTKDHPLVTIIGDTSKPVSTRRKLSTDPLWCYFHAFLAKKEPKNYKEAMEESCWIKAMQEEIHEFERLEIVVKGYRREERIDLDVKTAFQNGQSKLDEDPNGTLVDPTRYRGMIGSLMLLIASRPDIMFVDCMCARYHAKPTEKHLTAVKWVFRYLKGTINMGLWYPRDISFNLTAFVDADHAGYKYYMAKKVESEKAKIVDKLEEQHISPIKSRRGKGSMCYGDQAANVPNKLKKDVVPRKTRSVSLAEETVVASRLKSLRQKKQPVTWEGSSAAKKYYSSSDTDSDATLYSFSSDKPEGSANETNDANESDMYLSNDNPDGDNDDARKENSLSYNISSTKLTPRESKEANAKGKKEYEEV
uniref:Integrase, catalytic region, zinc finger, CCHC-type, peptidase aspartic, catalytic n=1 Tax=Tanacetum cinerariifolium TaxID=118510 RepID=A0A6L2KPN0_TANCI|nr:integrase, catalytic region, zinc finger, CCHC-type, peptidase aspartic, catalytic [Tanacetum cinerariifolium]